MNIKLNKSLILASASATRADLLSRHGLLIDSFPAQINEEKLKIQECVNMKPEEMALFLAKQKALDVSLRFQDTYIVGADQVCLLGDKVFDKPGSFENAVNHLKELRSKIHIQNCAMVLAYNSEIIFESLSKAEISMRDLSDNEISAYVNLEKPFNSAGSYMLEKHGKHLFKEIKGDHDVILGLDIVKLFSKLYELEIISIL